MMSDDRNAFFLTLFQLTVVGTYEKEEMCGSYRIRSINRTCSNKHIPSFSENTRTTSEYCPSGI